MGVSRTPVHEALYALAAEGLVTFGEVGGARVIAFEYEEVDLGPANAAAVAARALADHLGN